jgi:hypothetical protein
LKAVSIPIPERMPSSIPPPRRPVCSSAMKILRFRVSLLRFAA